MKHLTAAIGQSLSFLLFGPAIAAKIGGGQMPEMRSAWLTQAMR